MTLLQSNLSQTIKKLFSNTWKKDKNQFCLVAAGTGKTFISLYLALKDVMDLKRPYDKVILVRSLIPTREIGFWRVTDEEDKSALYQCRIRTWFSSCLRCQTKRTFNGLYDKLKSQSSLYFLSTSFSKGIDI